ncbi:hypothetical protein ACFO25_01735 [Paenactinomyces guangxiensis]|uniref:Uncharacterized protein n=1 Tax=Paenactinomyces guangxiensis TaxID=1490290 RepID=A0A7W1WRW6_9BACL|nr:hypothetical protein [Paenactinomyces guangxiensis]MBA4494949.1 hypothetical protein [Paenactinomyces guangxiensis]MBH8592032.1 hypothetical protein [Paenactinomyces guangxiensis]
MKKGFIIFGITILILTAFYLWNFPERGGSGQALGKEWSVISRYEIRGFRVKESIQFIYKGKQENKSALEATFTWKSPERVIQKGSFITNLEGKSETMTQNSWGYPKDTSQSVEIRWNGKKEVINLR